MNRHALDQEAGGRNPPVQRSGKRLWIGLALAVVLVFLAANAHFAFLAFSTQPECVAHLKASSGEPGDAGTGFRAAKSAC